MDNLDRLLDKGHNLLKFLRIEHPKKNHWNYANCTKGTLVGVIIAVAGLIFAQVPVLILGSLIATVSTLGYYFLKNKVEEDLISMFQAVVQKLEKPETPRSLKINPFEKLTEKENQIRQMQGEIDFLKSKDSGV